jgi:hypothetical protein
MPQGIVFYAISDPCPLGRLSFVSSFFPLAINTCSPEPGCGMRPAGVSSLLNFALVFLTWVAR